MLIEESLEKFKELPIEIIASIDNERMNRKLEKLEEEHGVRLHSLLIFLAVSDVSRDDIERYLIKEFGVRESKAREIKKDFLEKILVPLEKRLNFLNNNPTKKSPSLEEEKDILEDMFKNKLTKELKEHSVIRKAVNFRIFVGLDNDWGLKKNLERDIYENKERLGSKPILLHDKQVASFVSNWIKLFVSEYGSDVFDNISLSKFISSSDEVAKLKEKEKDILINILKTYFNIKFFSQRVKGDDIRVWEILPVETRENRESKKDNKIKPSSKNKKVSPQDTLRRELDKYEKKTLERKAAEEELKK